MYVPLSIRNLCPLFIPRHEDSSDDDVPIQQLAKKRAGNGSSNKAELGAADSDDDLSLAALKKKVGRLKSFHKMRLHEDTRSAHLIINACFQQDGAYIYGCLQQALP